MVGGSDFVNDFVKISQMFLLPIPYSLYRDPDLVDYSSEFINEFQTEFHDSGRHLIASPQSACSVCVGVLKALRWAH